jgi:hypothetical protein
MTDSSRASAVTPRLNVALWIVQVLVALGFAMAGSLKLTAPVEVLASTLAWSEGVPIAMDNLGFGLSHALDNPANVRGLVLFSGCSFAS